MRSFIELRGPRRDRRNHRHDRGLCGSRELVADVFAEGIEATVPMTVRETVGAISSLKKNEVSLGQLAAKLALDKSVTSRRVRDATDRGYVVNLEIRRGRPARIVLGEPMPEVVKLLPKPHELDS
jgi:hypothetical protein